MTIHGLENAITIAIDRVSRSKEPICIVEIANDEYVLWRESTKALLSQMYKVYTIVMIVKVEVK